MKNTNTSVKVFFSLIFLSGIIFGGLKIIYGQTSLVDTNTSGTTTIQYSPPTIPTTLNSPSNTSTTTSGNTSGSTSSKDIIQPRPQIIHPLNNSLNLSGDVLVEIYINPTVILEMKTFGINSSGQTILLPGNPATQTGGTNYSMWWNTKSVPNGEYKIFAVATLSNQIKTYSDKIIVTVKNIQESISTSPTTTEIGQVQNSNGTFTQQSSNDQSQVTALQPQTNIPISAAPVVPNPVSSQSLIDNSRLLTSVNFKLDQDKPLNLATIETRQNQENQDLIILKGRSYPDSYVIISIFSNPLVLSAKTDVSGNWSYVLEDPLNPGKHEVFVEVTTENGTTEKSGPYPFSIARAQATATNPDGNSLHIIDPQVEAKMLYLYFGGGAVILGLILITIFFLIKRKNLKKVHTQPLR